MTGYPTTFPTPGDEGLPREGGHLPQAIRVSARTLFPVSHFIPGGNRVAIDTLLETVTPSGRVGAGIGG